MIGSENAIVYILDDLDDSFKPSVTWLLSDHKSCLRYVCTK